MGLADSFIASDQIPALIDTLATTDAEPAIALMGQVAPASNLTAQRSWIDQAFAGESVAAIID